MPWEGTGASSADSIPRWAASPLFGAAGPLLRPSGKGTELAPALRAKAEREFVYDFSRVRIHDDAETQAALTCLDADAASAGSRIFLGPGRPASGTPAERRLLWHELAHVVQQAGPPHPAAALLSAPGSAQERLADEVADGQPASTIRPIPGIPLIHRQGRHKAPQALDVNEVRRVMTAGTDATAGARAALDLLRQHPLEDVIPILAALDREQRLETIAGVLAAGDRSPLAGAIFAVLFLSANQRTTPSWGVVAAFVIGQLPEAERMTLLEQVLRATGRAEMIPLLREGMTAFTESEAARAAQPVQEVDPSAANVAPTMAGVTPGPWNPPGKQPIGFYLGLSAHTVIAAEYASMHLTDEAFYNVVSVATIVAAARRLGLVRGAGRASSGQAAMEPDIANLTRRHLYEIKPAKWQALGKAEAALYVAAFAAAGLAMGFGPTNEPGTSGVIPAPGGWYTFRSPEPGVITYDYSQPPRVRVRVPVRAPARKPAEETSKSLRERISEITGLTGAALTVYIIISEGSRILIPPRNMIPAP